MMPRHWDCRRHARPPAPGRLRRCRWCRWSRWAWPLIFFRILSSVILLKVSRPLATTTSSLWPGMRSSGRACHTSRRRCWSRWKPGTRSVFSAPKMACLSWVKSTRMWVFMSNSTTATQSCGCRLRGEDVRRVQRVVHEVVVGGSELHQQHRGDRRLAHGDALDLLRHAVFPNLEVLLAPAPAARPAGVRPSAALRVDGHHGHIDVQRVLRNVGRLAAWAAEAASSVSVFLGTAMGPDSPRRTAGCCRHLVLLALAGLRLVCACESELLDCARLGAANKSNARQRTQEPQPNRTKTTGELPGTSKVFLRIHQVPLGPDCLVV